MQLRATRAHRPRHKVLDPREQSVKLKWAIEATSSDKTRTRRSRSVAHRGLHPYRDTATMV
jgi:hypothetical protein